MKHRCTLMLLAGVLGLGIGPMARAGKDPEERYIVKYREAVTSGALRSGRQTDLRVERELPNHHAAALRLTPAEAAAMARDPAVEFMEPDPVRVPVGVIRAKPSGADILPSGTTPSQQITPYGISLVQAKGLPGVRSARIKVCVIDSGYDLGHEDKPLSPTVTGVDDLLGAGPWREDGNGHGTHVSGTINAKNNTVGVLGVFPGAPMHIVRVFGNEGTWMYSSDLVAALDRCMAAGAKVINMSLGGDAPSTLERTAFRAAYDAGVIAVAAAGNDGDTRYSFPASYPSVISVAAIDQNLRRAPFSNRNNRVTLAAPGVSVLSTVPRGTVSNATLQSPLGSIGVIPMDNFPIPANPVSAPLADCGLAETPADCIGAQGAICLIERGTVTFAVKARSCQAAGGVGALVYNQSGETGPVYGTLGTTRVSIPVVGTDRATGVGLRDAYLGSPVTLTFDTTTFDYDYYSGTSMATPHVAGVAALVWSRHPACDSATIRKSLNVTARDLGVPGRDPQYGLGMVRAKAANAWLDLQPCALN